MYYITKAIRVQVVKSACLGKTLPITLCMSQTADDFTRLQSRETRVQCLCCCFFFFLFILMTVINHGLCVFDVFIIEKLQSKRYNTFRVPRDFTN